NLTPGRTYYVIDVVDANSFTLGVAPALGTLVTASAAGGTAYYDTPGGQQVLKVTDGSGHVSFNPGAAGHFRVKMIQREVGYQARPFTDDGQRVDASGDITQYVHLSGQPDVEVNVGFSYKALGLIEGRFLSDLDTDGQCQLRAPGVAGATVSLDENNNGQPDAGEPRAATDGDGVYRFLHDFNPEAPSSNPDSPRQVVAGALRPLASAAVQAISQGPVTTAAPHGFSRGGVFQFQGLANALGVQNGVTYYVVDAPTDTTFTFADRPGGPALAAVSAAGGTAVGAATTITAHNLQPGSS